jgi:hypothetical protein
MKRLKTRKWLALLSVGALALAITVGVAAYFTQSGSGSGQANVGTSSAIQLSSATPVSSLYPGGSALGVTVTIHNPGNGSQYVGTISGTVADNGGCLGSWFTVSPVAYNQTLAAGASDTASSSIQMNDSGTNQDACQGKSMTINWSSN